MQACDRDRAGEKSLEVASGDSRLRWRRQGDCVQLETEERCPKLTRELRDLSDEAQIEAVESLCRDEIERMRRQMHGLADALVNELDDDGDRAHVVAPGQWQEERTWKLDNDVLAIAGTRTQTRGEFHVAGVSEASLAAGILHSFIRVRQAALRSVYAQLLSELLRETEQGHEGQESSAPGHRSPPRAAAAG